MEPFWTGLLGALAGGGVMAFVVRGLFQQLLSRDLERFKAELQAENATALEGFRADLRERSFRHERLHELRIELVSEIYGQLYETIQALNRALYTEEDDVEGAISEARENVNALHRRIVKGMPFVSRPLADRLKTVNRRLRRIHVRVEWDRGKRGDRWGEAIELLGEDLQPVLIALEEELRAFVERGDAAAALSGEQRT